MLVHIHEEDDDEREKDELELIIPRKGSLQIARVLAHLALLGPILLPLPLPQIPLPPQLIVILSHTKRQQRLIKARTRL